MSVMELVSEEQVLGAVKSKGPVIPMEIRQIIKCGDSITIGATLSTLADRGIVLITHIKRGGSPFYYVKGQEERLAELSKYLGEKDRRTFEALRQSRVLADKAEEPLTRVSLRNIPDFARSISIDTPSGKEIFWHYYLVSEAEALAQIKSGVEMKNTEPKQEAAQAVQKKESAPAITKEPEKKEEKEKPQEERKPKEKKEAKKAETQKEQKEIQKEDDGFLVHEDIQQKLSGAVNPQIISQFNDAFISRIGAFLSEAKIIVNEAKQIKKGAEYDLVLDIPTPVGMVQYFCKAKSKKKCTEADLSSAFVQGQGMRLQVLFMTTGEVVKKAKEKLRSDFKGLIVKELS